MQLLKVKIFALIVFIVDNIQTELSPDGENVCLIKETYKDKIMIKNRVPKVTNKKKWCWNIYKKFSCDYSVVDWVDVTEFRPINRTKIVPKCCDGYFEAGTRVKYCFPICLKGCGNGRCIAPGICNCYSGFHGPNCDKACPDGLWGENCAKTCECFNGGKCDNLHGVCDCEKGWIGNKCEFPCQDGYYGYQCKIKCDCGNFSCNHKTGECFTSTELITMEIYSKLSESTEILTKTEKTNDEYTNDDVIGIMENSTSEEIIKIISMIDESTSSSINATKNTVFSHLPSENTEETEMNSVATLLSETFTDDMSKLNKKEKLIYEEKSERNFQDGLETSKYSINDYYGATDSAIIDETTHSFKNNPINNMSRVKLRGNEQVSDNVINEEKSSHRTTIFYFLPALFAFSSASFLTFIIMAIWLITKYRDKNKKKLALTEKKHKILQLEEKIKYPTENFFWSNSFTNNPVCLSDIDLNRTPPVLKTFKPLTSVESQMKKK